MDYESSDDEEDGPKSHNAPYVAPGQGYPATSRRKSTIVASESEKLRSLFTWVARTDTPTECTLDDGSQIVGINDQVAYALKIPYDPTKRRRMISANGTVDMTLGLAKNVPVELGGGIVVYLQMHVVKSAPYQILLGRPFMTVMRARSSNSMDGQLSITVTCPNSNRELTLPTYAHGDSPSYGLKVEGFRTSRI